MKQKWHNVAIVASVVGISAVAWAGERTSLGGVQPFNMSVTRGTPGPKTIKELAEKLGSEKIYGLVDAQMRGTTDAACEAKVAGTLYNYFKKMDELKQAGSDPLRSVSIKRKGKIYSKIDRVMVDFGPEFKKTKWVKKTGSDDGASKPKSVKKTSSTTVASQKFEVEGGKAKNVAVLQVGGGTACALPPAFAKHEKPAQLGDVELDSRQGKDPESDLCLPHWAENDDPRQRQMDFRERLDFTMGKGRRYHLRRFTPVVTAQSQVAQSGKYTIEQTDILNFDGKFTREEFEADPELTAIMTCNNRAVDAWVSFLCRHYDKDLKVRRLLSSYMIDETTVRGLYLDSGIDHELAHKDESFDTYKSDHPGVLKTRLGIQEKIYNLSPESKTKLVAQYNAEIAEIESNSQLSDDQKAAKVKAKREEIRRVENAKAVIGNAVEIEYLFNSDEFAASPQVEDAGCHYIDNDKYFYGLIDRTVGKRLSVRAEKSQEAAVRENTPPAETPAPSAAAR